MWVLSEIKEKVCCFINLTLDKSHFITEVVRKGNIDKESLMGHDARKGTINYGIT